MLRWPETALIENSKHEVHLEQLDHSTTCPLGKQEGEPALARKRIQEERGQENAAERDAKYLR